MKQGDVVQINHDYSKKYHDKNICFNKKGRPYVITHIDRISGIAWAAPLTSSINNYYNKYQNDLKYHKDPVKYFFTKMAGKKSVVLIQNMIPLTKKDIHHYHQENGEIFKFKKSIASLITKKAIKALDLEKKGKHIIKTDVFKLQNEVINNMSQNLIKENIINQYKKSFPAIKFIDKDTAMTMFKINQSSKRSLSIKEMEKIYHILGHKCEDGIIDKFEHTTFNRLNKVINNLNHYTNQMYSSEMIDIHTKKPVITQEIEI